MKSRLAPKSISPCLPSAEVLVSVTEDMEMSKPSDFAHAAGVATARNRSRQLGQAFERHFAGY